MNVLQLDTPVKARWYRSLELQSITFENRSLALRVLENYEDCEDYEDSSGKNWFIRFNTIQGLKMTTHESALGILYEINEEGAFFEFKRSKWLYSLGLDKVHYMAKSRHFVVCCYDEVVEVAAWEIDFVQD